MGLKNAVFEPPQDSFWAVYLWRKHARTPKMFLDWAMKTFRKAL